MYNALLHDCENWKFMKKNGSELAGKRIFITGHTGFTGSWASIWLSGIGAKVFGYSLAPETSPNLFSEARVVDLVEGTEGDIRDFAELQNAMMEFRPDIVLHLAAQPLVRRSYRIPMETFEINTQGTVNVLEAARSVPSVRGILCITTDKVYRNLNQDHKYVETDMLGGKDPYSASKAAAEFVISSFRESYRGSGAPKIAVARGGNIIGGGDWSEDRLIPDVIRASYGNDKLEIRNPNSTRPWQHVLSLVEGYIEIMAGLIGKNNSNFDQAFNLGPIYESPVSVKALIEYIQVSLPELKFAFKPADLHEESLLSLDSRLAVEVFGWQPEWDTSESIQKTIEWYKNYYENPGQARQLCLEQIDSWNNGVQRQWGFKVKAVILAGGLGTRIAEESDSIPKPMVEIGGRPMLWHIMKMYANHGITDFIVCLGYKGYLIKEYFLNYYAHTADLRIELKTGKQSILSSDSEPWTITLVDTGPETMTGGRLKRVEKYLAGETFCLTYGDGVSDIDISAEIEFHKSHGKLATVASVQPPGRFALLDIDTDGTVTKFEEKRDDEVGWINAGFFVLESSVIDRIRGDETVWEREPLEGLSADNQLVAFKHDGFWQPMDTLRERRILEKLWAENSRIWLN